MFDQTFVPVRATKKPAAIAVSVVAESSAIALLAIVSICYSGRLPYQNLRLMLVAPRPPVHVAPEVVKTAGPATMTTQARLFRFHPTDVSHVSVSHTVALSAVAAPDIDTFGSASSSGDLLSVVGSPAVITAVPKPEVPAKRIERLRVGGTVEEANLISKVLPQYPRIAQMTNTQGTVEFVAVIGRDGRVENVRYLSGPALLVKAAEDAILQWRYRPTLLNGSPVEVLTNISVTFTLRK